MMPPLDPRKTPIEINSRVAFNMSGYVAIGTVVALTHGHRFPARILRDKVTDSYQQDGGISKVQNPRSVLVLKDGDHRV